MPKIHLILPFVGIAAFGFVYHDFSQKEEIREQAAKQTARLEKERQIKEEIEAREKSIQDALRLQAERKKAREIREALEKKQREERQAALDARQKAFNDTEKLARQTERLRKDVAAEQNTNSSLSTAQKGAAAEKAFSEELLTRAKQNLRDLENVLEKIAAAEAAIALARAAATPPPPAPAPAK
jgi:hypothetical protein